MSAGIFAATAMPDREWWRALWPEPGAVLSAMGLQERMAAIDLCCGDGYFTASLARIAQRSVYGIDLDPHLLEIARVETEGTEAWPCIFIQGDARELSSLVLEQVDYVFLANTFHGVEGKTELAREVWATLRPGGHFGIVNWHRRRPEETIIFEQPRGPRFSLRMTPADTRQAVEPAGFELERLIELPPYHYGAIFQKPAE